MKITAVLVDDEVSNRNVLKNLLNTFCPEIEVVGEANNIDMAYKVILNKKPQVVFLDIQMPNGNGFSLLKRFDQIPFQLIFVTSFDQYAITAIKYSALDYILKPIAVDELKVAVKKAAKLILEKSNNTAQVVNLLSNSSDDEIVKKITLHHKGKVRFIKVNEIVSIEGDVNYSDLFLNSGEKIVTTKTLKDMEDLLENDSSFLRISKSCIINVHYVTDYSKKEPYFLTLSNGKEFEISRRKKQEVNEKLSSLL